MRCIIGTVLTDGGASLTASLEPSQLMAPVLSLRGTCNTKNAGIFHPEEPSPVAALSLDVGPRLGVAAIRVIWRN